MAPSAWDDEESESTPPSSPTTAPAVVRRGKFEDEEDDSDVLDSWENEEDSEVEREKAKKAVEAKAAAEAEAKANHKTKTQRIEERRQEALRQRAEESSSEEEEDEAEKRARLRATEQDADLRNAEDLFGAIGISDKRSAPKPITIAKEDDQGQTIDLSALPLFNPTTKDQFTKLRETLAPLLAANAKKAQYTIFMQEFAKTIVKDLPSDQIKKVASALTALSNEKMKEEKAAEKGGKKTKAAKTKTSLAASRDIVSRADTTAYDGGLDEQVPSYLLRSQATC
ncbi:Translation initiation factor 3 subunit J component [Elasticomyces elasticus]|nr:Translation initiation factor 3 subunit J component [Elasticomyces elasticus]